MPLRRIATHLARIALTCRAAVEAQVAMLREQHAALATQEAQLIANRQRLAERIETFRIQKDAFTATYSGVEAEARANQAIAGLGGTMVEATQTLQRAQREESSRSRARVLATEELLATRARSPISAAPPIRGNLTGKSPSCPRITVDKQLAADEAFLGSRHGAKVKALSKLSRPPPRAGGRGVGSEPPPTERATREGANRNLFSRFWRPWRWRFNGFPPRPASRGYSRSAGGSILSSPDG